MAELLTDLKVLDVTEEYNSYAGKLMGDLGAEVIKVERPGGDPARGVPPQLENNSAFYGFLNTSKRGLMLNPSTTVDRRKLHSLVESVDIVLEDFLPQYGLDPVTLPESTHTETIVVSLTGFGRIGPFSDYESVELIEEAMGGMAYQTGFPDRPPTRPGRSICSYFGAMEAAVGALMALRARSRVGGQHVDVSKQEAVAARLESSNTDYSYNNTITQRSGNTHSLGHPVGAIYEVRDGYVCVCIIGDRVEGPMGGVDASMWEPFLKTIGREDLLQDERFNDLPDEPIPGGVKRLRNSDEFDAIMEKELADWSTEEFYYKTQEAGVATAVVATVDDLFENDQIRSRDFFSEVELPNGETVTIPRAPYQFSGVDEGEPTQPPALGEHDEEIEEELLPNKSDEETVPLTQKSPSRSSNTNTSVYGALDGLRILDFTMVWAGPHCTVQLADHGAEVIKVESEYRSEAVRHGGPFYENEQGDPLHGEDRSGYYQTENRGKKSLTVNLKTREGIELIKELVAEADIDVVVESFSPGVMDKLGLDFETLRGIKEDLVMCSLSGFGQEGPESHYRAYGPSLEAQAGLAYLTGFPEDDPVRTAISFVDPVAGLHGTFAIMAAIHHRDKTGEGRYIDLSQQEAGAVLTHQAVTTYDSEGTVLGRIGNHDERDRVVQGFYRCAETETRDDLEEWVGIAIRNKKDWEAFTNVVDAQWTENEQFSTQEQRLRHHDALDEHIQEWTRKHGRYELMDRLQSVGVPAGVVQTTKDLVENDVALRERGFWETTNHPVVGEQPYPGANPSFSKTPGGIRSYAPMIGQHTREVLYRTLNLSGERVNELENKEVLT